MIGIYKITNKMNGKVYIGQATNLETRLSEHKQKRFVPIDMVINCFGVENFDFEIIEECPKEELDEKEQYYITEYNSRINGYNKQEGGFNNSVGEGNGRAKLTEEDVIKIRIAYKNHSYPKEVYKEFKDKITLSQFQAVWQGRSWGYIMPEVYTPENKQFYTTGQFREKSSLTLNEVLKYRKAYVNKTAKEVYDQYLEENKDKELIVKYNTFRKILTGDVKAGSPYNQVPLYKKTIKRWELNNEPVSTIPESWK